MKRVNLITTLLLLTTIGVQAQVTLSADAPARELSSHTWLEYESDWTAKTENTKEVEGASLLFILIPSIMDIESGLGIEVSHPYDEIQEISARILKLSTSLGDFGGWQQQIALESYWAEHLSESFVEWHWQSNRTIARIEVDIDPFIVMPAEKTYKLGFGLEAFAAANVGSESVRPAVRTYAAFPHQEQGTWLLGPSLEANINDAISISALVAGDITGTEDGASYYLRLGGTL